MSPNSRLLYYSLRGVKVTATASVSCRFSFVEECLLSAPCLPAVKACGHTGIRRSRQHFCPQRHWSPPQTALFCICDTWCPARSHKKQQGREQLMCKVVTTQGHWLVPFLGGFILVLSPQQAALPQLRTMKSRSLLFCSFQKSKQRLCKCNNFYWLFDYWQIKKIKRVRELNWLYFFFLFYRNKPNKANPLTVAGEKCFRPGKDSGYPTQDRGAWDRIWGQETLSLE